MVTVPLPSLSALVGAGLTRLRLGLATGVGVEVEVLLPGVGSLVVEVAVAVLA